LRPENFIDKIPTLQEETSEEFADEERHLYALSNHAGWKALKEHIQSVLRELDELNASAMETGANFEAIGQNAVIITTVKGVIKRILDKVEDAKEARENADGTAK